MVARRYRIFVSSPADVRHERAIAERVIAKLSRDFAHHCEVVPLLWEHEPLLASRHFQDFDNILPPSSADICITILWSTLGVPLPSEKFRGAISGREVTGTEWEFEDALSGFRAHGHPDLLVYQKTADIVVSLSDEAALERMRRQKHLVADFFARWFKSADGEGFTAACHVFTTAAEFEARLEEHLRALLLRRLARDLGLEGEPGAITWTGPPWPALAPFNMHQAPVFFGRSRARNELLELLAAQVKAGTAFVLLIGASGAGKSSLVRAGLLPDLTLPGMIGNVALVRSCILRPSEAGADPLRALAAAMFSPTALPELAALQYDTETLAAQLRQAPAQAAFAVQQGLAASASGKLTTLGQARLVVVADQLEELFTIERIFPQVREAFVAALAALARSGLVWVIGTLRADFFPYLEHLPSLAELSASGRYLLLPPNLAELGEIATRPARAAGLHFEVNAAGISLDSVIIAAASRDQGGLPLLSFTLDALWRQPRTGTTLTFDGYERLGGLEGAIATHAERVVSALPEAALAALPGVLLGLVTIREADQSPTGRAANLADLAGNPSAKMLVERLIEARLLVADETEQGITVRLTHEALLRSWPRLAGLIEGSRESLASIARLRTAAAEWERHGRSADLLLPRGKRLSEGVELLEGQLHAINDKLAGFIRESAASARAARRRRRFLITGAFAALCVLTVSAGLGAWFGLSGRLAAEASRNAFREQFEIAERSRAQILALALVNEADPGVIEAVSLSVLASQPDLRRHDEQGSGLLDRLIVAANAKRQRMVLAGHGNQAVSAAFSRDGTRIVTGSFDRKIRIWSASTGALLLTLSGHADQVESAVYSPDGTRIVSASDDRTARIWDATSGAPLLTLSGHGGIVNSANFSPDGRRIVTASDDKTARVWDASTGGLLTTLTGHGAGVSFASFSPDGKTIVTASNDKTARLWDAATGVMLKTLSGHGNFVMAAAFSPDGARIVTACYDKMARVWDSASGALLTTLAGHNGGITFAVFSPDGRRIATASADKTARIWDSDTGALLETLVGHKHVVTSVAFSPDGRLLASASFDNTARIWDVAGTSRFLALSGHQAPISKVRFSPDGRRIATASADKTAKIWDGASGKELGTLIGHDDAVFGLGFSPDGQRLVTGSVDMSVRIWNAESATLQKILAQGGAVVTSTAFSPDGRFVATTSMDKRARILDAATGAPVTVFIGHTGMLRSASFSPDQRRIVTASLDNTARVWDTATGATLLTLSGHGADVTDARFSPDGRLIVTASADKTARIWDAATGRMLHILTGHEDSLRSASFSPDGKQIVTASLDGSTRVWDAASGAPLARFSAQGAAVRDAAFSPDGRRIATASDDKLARVWDAADLLDTHDLPFIRATSSRGLDSALRAQYALGPAPKAEHFPIVPACANDNAGVAAWTAGANAGDGVCQARLATLLEGTDLAKDFFRHALAARLLEAQGFEEAAQQERYRREALAWSLPRSRVAELMQAADAWHPGPSPNPLPR